MKIRRGFGSGFRLLVLAALLVFIATPARAHDPHWTNVCGSPAGCFDSQYLFGVTRELRDSGGNRAVVALVSPITLALDIGFFPFEVILGFLN
jgi:hypothetical protein